MENKEIKLELCKAMLHNPNFVPTDLQKMYEWILEEPEVEVKTIDKNSFDDIDIKEVLHIIRKNQRFNSGIATSLETIFNTNNINTVGDLVRIGRRDFSAYRLVGKKSVLLIDDALDELGVTTW